MGRVDALDARNAEGWLTGLQAYNLRDADRELSTATKQHLQELALLLGLPLRSGASLKPKSALAAECYEYLRLASYPEKK